MEPSEDFGTQLLEDLDKKISGEEEYEANPDRTNPFGESTDRALRNINKGVGLSLGIPSAIVDGVIATNPVNIMTNFRKEVAERHGYTTGEPETNEDMVNPFISGPEILDFFEQQNMTFSPEDQPDEMSDRIVQNLGAALVFAPYLPLTPAALAVEGGAAFTGAVTGKLLQDNTEFGRDNPDLARALGEITGGIGGGVSTASMLGSLRAIRMFMKNGGTYAWYMKKGKNVLKKIIPTKEERVGGRIKGTNPEIEASIQNIDEANQIDEFKNLSPAEKAGTIGTARLQATIESTSPDIELQLRTQRNKNIEDLERKTTIEGDVDDTRRMLELKQAKLIDEAGDALRLIKDTDDPAAISTIVQGKLKTMYDDFRNAEARLWNKQPKSLIVEADGSEINKFFIEVQKKLKTDTGSFKQDVDAALFQKLGTRQPVMTGKQGRPELKLQGGELFVLKKNADGKLVDSATVQSMHSFYSKLGERIQKLSTIRGQAAKIRLLTQARNAIFKDLDRAGAGEQYRKLIDFSRVGNKKFTQGAVGKVLGFERGDIPFETQSLDIILGSGGEIGLQNAKQALNASPQAKIDMGNFLKSKFALYAKNELNDKVNVDRGRQFMRKHRETLDELFPEVKAELDNAITTQASVDEISGVGQISKATPLQKERYAAAFFLNQNPNEEMDKLLRLGNIQRTEFLTDIVAEVGKDKSGRALAGLKNAFGQELVKFSRKAAADGTDVISGTRMMTRLNQLEKTILSSKLLTPEEFGRMKRIAEAFRKIQFVQAAEPLSGGVIDDLTGKLLSIPLRGFAATAGGRLGGNLGGMGGGLRTANIFSKEMDAFLQGFTNDGAKALLIRSVVDEPLMKDLLTNASKLKPKERIALFERIKAKAREAGIAVGTTPLKLKRRVGDVVHETVTKVLNESPASAFTPAAATVSEATNQDIVQKRDEELRESAVIKEEIQEMVKQALQ